MQDSTIGVFNQDGLIKLVHKIKSSSAASSLYFGENKENTLKLIDKVIIKFKCWVDKQTDEIIELINQNSDKKYDNSGILQFFKRFIFIFRKNDCSKVQLINNSFPFCENLSFDLNSTNDLESVTNPILYQNGIELLELHDTSNKIHFSDKFISNICEINPKSVLIESKKFLYKKESNFIDVLLKLPSKMKITLSCRNLNSQISLIFSNTVLKISQNDGDNSSFFECKSFLYEIHRDNIKNIKFEDHSSEPDLDCLKLRLRNNYKIEFEELNPLTEEQASKHDNCFPQHILDNENGCTVAVFVKNLKLFKLQGLINSLNDPDCNLDRLISKCSGLKYFFSCIRISICFCIPIQNNKLVS